MQHSREFVLAELRRVADELGATPGKLTFEKKTGIRESHWSGKYWARWTDVLAEAGLTSNEFNGRLSTDDELVRLLAGLALELGHYPVVSERKLKRQSDPTFPNAKTFDSRLGNRARQTGLLRELAEEESAFSQLLSILPAPAAARHENGGSRTAEKLSAVYLMRSGKYFKIGRSNHVGRRSYEVALQLPEPLTVIHEIATDDPEGIEAYWHGRFASKRKNGEWFELSADEVAIFKRRKLM